MKRKNLYAIASLLLALLIAASAYTFAYQEAGSTTFTVLSIIALAIGGGLTACIARLIRPGK